LIAIRCWRAGPARASASPISALASRSAIYNNYRPPNIEITFVTSSPRWASKEAIRAMLRYPFVQLGCARLTAVTPAQNRPARAFLARLGFRQEGVHPDALPGGDAVSYGLLARDAARWIA
jgi:RimJ/RimL family protein N-acetyltransferase